MTLEERFLAKVNKTETCWLWTGRISKDGYGRISVKNKTCEAHRVAYELWIGPIPPGLQIDHVLERGCIHRNCVNPAHLEAVTFYENIRRSPRSWQGGVSEPRNACPKGHPYTPENTIIGKDRRKCRTCKNAARRRARLLAKSP